MSKVAIISPKGDKIIIHAAGCKHLAKKDLWGYSVEEAFGISKFSGQEGEEAWIATICEEMKGPDADGYNWKANYATCAK
jgi:hypothetical protein